MANSPPDLAGALSEMERERLAAFLARNTHPDALTLEGMDGLFCALIAGPEAVLPGEYLPLVWGGDENDTAAFKDLDEAKTILPLIMRHWNSIIADLEQDGVYSPLILRDDAQGVPGREWAQGFMRGVGVRFEGWKELISTEQAGQLVSIPLVAGQIDADWPHETVEPEQREELIVSMAAAFARAYRHFKPRRLASAAANQRETKKAARADANGACPCGSGKSFKECCGAGDRGPVH